MLDNLAFLPVHEVEAGMAHLRTIMPDDQLLDLVDYFDATYVPGTRRKIKRPGPSLTIRRRGDRDGSATQPAPVTEARSCPICLSNATDIALISCGHCACISCVNTLMWVPLANGSMHLCPVCRSDIRDFVRIRFAV